MQIDRFWFEWIGNDVHCINVVAHQGGGGSIHIYVDSYYNGCAIPRQGVWELHLHETSILGPQQKLGILETIKNSPE